MAIDQEISAVFERFNLERPPNGTTSPTRSALPLGLLPGYLAGNIPRRHTIATVPPMKLERPAVKRARPVLPFNVI
jgi:hypothetical protein